MEIRYYKEYSRFLGQNMEFKVYGHSGQACLYFPCQNGRFYDFENFGMLEHCGPLIEEGRLRVFTADTVDGQSLSAVEKSPWERLARQEDYYHYIADELAPEIDAICRESGEDTDGIMTLGFSMGAYHAANFFFRRPDIFHKAICCSGLYRLNYLLGDYMDANVYANSPVDCLLHMPADHRYISLYNRNRLIVCTGQGAWEHPMIESTAELKAVLEQKGIHAWVDFWGTDVCHDWPWWKKQVDYFLPVILSE